jgi:glycosyltransferase involved in cell wall biosynthesis
MPLSRQTAMSDDKKQQSIIYVNFAPYENAGRILDYLVNKFGLVILFSFSFHKLNRQSQANYVHIYIRGELKKEIKLFDLPTPEALVFITLPFIVVLISLQTLWYMWRFKADYGPFNYYLTVNAFTAWLGNVLRGFGLVKKTIFWVWDYYPPGYPDWRIKLARSAYWQFDKWSSTHSSSTIFLNKRLIQLRQKIGVLSKQKQYAVVPIGTKPGKITLSDKLIIGHFGVLKQSQGLDFLLDNLPLLQKKIPGLAVEVVGSGPDEAHFKSRAEKLKNIYFHGFIKEENNVDMIIRGWSMGIATYKPERSSPASWTDPSKIKAYLSQGVPVITTNIVTMAEDIKSANAGLIIHYGNSDELIKAIKTILKNQAEYKESALKLAEQFSYQKLYNKLFES